MPKRSSAKRPPLPGRRAKPPPGTRLEQGIEQALPVEDGCQQAVEAQDAYGHPGAERPARGQVFEGCRDVVARYLGGTVNGIRLGFLAWGANDERWKYGDR